MKCHVLSCGPPKMSCFVMVCCASGPVAAHPYPACGSSIAFRSTPFPPPRRTRRALQMAALTPPAPNAASIANGGVDAAGSPAWRDPVSRVSRPRARPSARVSAGAVRAPDCARARETPKSGRTSPVRFSRVFLRRREPGRRAAPGRPLPSSRLIWARQFESQPNLGKYFNNSNKPVCPARFHC